MHITHCTPHNTICSTQHKQAQAADWDGRWKVPRIVNGETPKKKPFHVQCSMGDVQIVQWNRRWYRWSMNEEHQRIYIAFTTTTWYASWILDASIWPMLFIENVQMLNRLKVDGYSATSINFFIYAKIALCSLV